MPFVYKKTAITYYKAILNNKTLNLHHSKWSNNHKESFLPHNKKYCKQQNIYTMERKYLHSIASIALTAAAIALAVPSSAQGRRPGGPGSPGGNRPSSSMSSSPRQSSPSTSRPSSSMSSSPRPSSPSTSRPSSSMSSSPRPSSPSTSRPSGQIQSPSPRPSSSGMNRSTSSPSYNNRPSGTVNNRPSGSVNNRPTVINTRPTGNYNDRPSTNYNNRPSGNNHGGGGYNGGNRPGTNGNNGGNRFGRDNARSSVGTPVDRGSEIQNNNTRGQFNRPDSRPGGNKPGGNPGGNGNHKPGGNPGGNGNHNPGGNGNHNGNNGNWNNRPGGGGGNHGGNHGGSNWDNRPGGNMGHRPPAGRPHGGINHGGPRPDYNHYRWHSSFRPRGPHDRWYDHYRYNRWSWRAPIAPPIRRWRPRYVWYYRPVIPVGYRIYASAPIITGILGLEFGTYLDASLNYLYYNGYNIDGYQDNVVYLRDVNLMGYSWPDVMLQYNDGGGLCYAEFATSSSYRDDYRFNNLFNSLCATYGTPINSGNGYYSWYGGNQTGFINLNFAYDDGRYYTVMTFGA